MEPERWRQITSIFNAALEAEPAERGTIVDRACGTDGELRSEVESLMAAHLRAGGFGNTPVSVPAPSLALAASLGPYRIEQLLGIGGMGEVYRAHDSKLGRHVAIKILPTHLTSDPERLARFEREARLVASLNHPHIGAIYGVDESDGRRALVMELVEGEDLSQRLARGPIPVPEALLVARQIAEALEAAHDQGIIHRDLKPANVKLRDDGIAKVLDFGLAKVLEPASPGIEAAAGSTATLSPHATQTGIIVGTAGYMSPERARGKAADKRADIWAFGVVFSEMLTATPLFTAATVAETLRRVIEKEPDVHMLPETTPPAIRALIARCLIKDPRNRLQAIGEARIALERAIATPHMPGSSAVVMPTTGDVAGALWHRVLPWAVVALACGGLGFWQPWRSGPPKTPLRLSAELGADASVRTGVSDSVALSPDGSVVAFVAHKEPGQPAQLYIRPLNQLQATVLRGTDDASSPFFSPDGQWIAFFARGALKKTSIAGGGIVTLCAAPNGRGGAWSEDGTIVFSPDSQPGVQLLRVPSGGNTPQPVTPQAPPEHWQRWPQFLPGGRAVLYTGDGTSADANDANIVWQSLAGGARKIVQHGAYHARYLPSGHLVFMKSGSLMAARFDPERAEVTGEAAAVVADVASHIGSGAAHFAVSAAGTLVYLQGSSTSSAMPIHWMSRDGEAQPLRAAASNWFNLTFAPDGQRLALQINTEGQNDIWIYDWSRDKLTPTTTHRGGNYEPAWTADGTRLAFASGPADTSALNLYWQMADGTGDRARLTESANRQLPRSWHPSGRFLAFEEQSSQTNWDLMVLPMLPGGGPAWGPGKPAVFLNSLAVERNPMFSPDGRWLAYDSNESGRQEVYVRPFPGPGRPSKISADGGTFATWSRTRQELFYSLDGQIMRAAYEVDGNSFRSAPPEPITGARHALRGQTRMFDVHPDGNRFALALAPQASDGRQDKLVVMFNFFEELRRITSTTHR